MARYSGRKGAVYMSTSADTAAIPVVSLTSWSIDRSTEKLDTTAFGDTSKVYVQGLPDAQFQFEGFWDDTDTTPYTASTSAGAVKLYLYPSLDAPSKYFYGTAWVDFSVNTSVNDAVKVSCKGASATSFTFNG